MRVRTRRFATLAVVTLAVVTLTVAPWTAVPVAAQSVTPAGDAGLSRLLAEIERLAPGSGGTVGVGAVHIETGRAVWFNEDERFPMASTYKVPIAVQLLSRVDRGEISLADMVELEPADIHPGSGTISNLFDDPGVALSLRNLMELMLLISDNSATDLTLTAAGGPDAVNARMAELRVDGLSVDRPTSSLIGDYSGVETPADGRISMAEFRERAAEVPATERAGGAGGLLDRCARHVDAPRDGAPARHDLGRRGAGLEEHRGLQGRHAARPDGRRPHQGRAAPRDPGRPQDRDDRRDDQRRRVHLPSGRRRARDHGGVRQGLGPASPGARGDDRPDLTRDLRLLPVQPGDPGGSRPPAAPIPVTACGSCAPTRRPRPSTS